MKSPTQRTIAIAAAVLLLSGAYAAAGEYVDIEQTGGGRAERGLSVSATPSNLADFYQNAGVIDIDQNDNAPRGGRVLRLRKPRPEAEPDSKGGRFLGTICLVNPVMGQMVCWGG